MAPKNGKYRCGKCHAEMKYDVENDQYACWKTHKDGRSVVSRAEGGIFNKSKLPKKRILHLIYCWLENYSYERIQFHEVGKEKNTEISTQTISDWLHTFRDILVKEMSEKYKEKIGGFGQTVEVDESKFGKRKYSRGWVFGAIDAEKRPRLYIFPENKRDQPTIQRVMDKAVAEGTMVFTHAWKAYNYSDKPGSGYEHESVNHSIEYVRWTEDQDLVTTNHIEAAWRPIEAFFNNRRLTREHFFHHLKEYEWRRLIESKEEMDLMSHFPALVAKYYPPTLFSLKEKNLPIDLPE